jgi:hypothetical protein
MTRLLFPTDFAFLHVAQSHAGAGKRFMPLAKARRFRLIEGTWSPLVPLRDLAGLSFDEAHEALSDYADRLGAPNISKLSWRRRASCPVATC